MQIKVLIVEDNRALNKSVINLLKKEGYAAFGATEVEEAKDIFLKEAPQIILLDIMLKDSSGYELIPFFKMNPDNFILMLTALDDKQSKANAYENGADDYITKPFDLYELIYKLRAIKRRIKAQQKVCQAGDVIFDMESNQLTCNGQTFSIQPSQAKFFKALYQKYQENTYLDKKEAIEWLNPGVDESFRLQTMVARLRKNLADIGSECVIIETVYGKGYRLVLIGQRSE
ncbi:response regulator transcription factor [Acetobacterium carbinolicum]|jgi:DNA-binding response OmpR family regulator|uniref:response regulator transcription factor n=1 Tax=Acetobacterium TaxID=33951 RepID=UPI000DBECAE8|nr:MULTISPECIES: response regulator transcription factor [unclassified Acetobacterium]AWW27487.1 hypothetical protein DOZ58_13100 [Acetobacterium sp. KB-1]MDZ5726070.1 response regulator transcription factor [Acetobacterium sp. K1/6]